MNIDEAMAELQRAGWHPDRQVPTDSAVDTLHAEGIATWPDLLAWLEQYSDLTLRSRDGSRQVVIDAVRAAMGVDAEWGRDYSEVIGCPLAPVANYSHMTIYLGQDGRLYGGFDYQFGFLGDDTADMLAAILADTPRRRLSMTLPREV